MALQLKPGTSWSDTFARAIAAAPEAFATDGPLNLVDSQWRRVGEQRSHYTPVDGSPIEGPFDLSTAEAEQAVTAAASEHDAWSKVDLDERRRLVSAVVEEMRVNRDLLAMLLVWEIGKPWALACADVDRCLSGVEWYVAEIERQLRLGTGHQRTALPGPVSNIASWNYPMSVLVHAELVQLLCGNAVIAKTPSQGGFHCLTLAHAIMRRNGLPATLISGQGATVGDPLVRSPAIGAIAFVGGRANGRLVTSTLADPRRRHLLEQEGLNTWGVWDFHDWPSLATHLTKGFEYGKQRCTAYPRYVVQRELFPEFLAMYLEVIASIRFGHPLAVTAPDEPLPTLHYGPLIGLKKAAKLSAHFDAACAGGGIPLYRGSLDDGHFIDGQDTSSYVAPAAVLSPPASWDLHHSEPFGPLDSIVLVDTEAELLAGMNVSNGSLVASIATDDADLAERLAGEVAAFKFGVNAPRSRGDRSEVFGGIGLSWKGAFVGGDLLVEAVTYGPDGETERLHGNFPDYTSYPSER